MFITTPLLCIIRAAASFPSSRENNLGSVNRDQKTLRGLGTPPSLKRSKVRLHTPVKSWPTEPNSLASHWPSHISFSVASYPSFTRWDETFAFLCARDHCRKQGAPYLFTCRLLLFPVQCLITGIMNYWNNETLFQHQNNLIYHYSNSFPVSHWNYP